MCQFFMENAEDKNPKINGGWTPLHIAAHEGHLEVCKLILEEQEVEDKNPKNAEGKTPLDYATTNGHFNIVQFYGNQVLGQGSWKDSEPKQTKMTKNE